MCKGYEKQKMEQIPLILRQWTSLYRATPKIYIPGTDVDIAFSLVCAVVFSALRLSFRYALYSFGWQVGATDTYFASACLASFCHSMLILPGLGAILLSQKYVPSGKLQPSPKWYQDATHSLMGFCTGYMIYDSIMGYVVETWQPGIGPVLSADDWSYLGHHILTSLYMTSARLKRAGHMSALMLMFNGEFSAPIMNMHLFMEKALAQECCKGISWLPTLFTYNEQFFSFLYLVCRVAVSPFVIAHVTYDLLLTKRGRGDVPLWLSISWMPMCWGVQIGSIPWIYTCIDTLKNGPGGGEHGEL
eukprot:CAMPEP_0183740830 /NCGR_PEP_ID=MMETSP0737-20130205/60597_1 /TAXON_ID=385413 /ORGANISM="Thalassiosira miniscula, Strain CCMP1093" /LENGTH=302 /DNA_ID=CAMNT_0025975983 /DNA_START=87 /DNA_END=995 /DNA_ORIENTATION=+